MHMEKCAVDNRGCSGTGCFRIEVRMDTADFTDMRIAVHVKLSVSNRVVSHSLVFSVKGRSHTARHRSVPCVKASGVAFRCRALCERPLSFSFCL